MKQNLVILADDLSGAADCAVPFARSGVPAEVFLQPELVQETEGHVVSVDLNTRELTPDEAIQATSRALTLIPADDGTVWYRKIDSILRGNIGPDVLATLRGIGDRRIIFCAPAFPDTGRTTVNGTVFVNGVPLEKSGIRHRWPKSLTQLFAEVGLQTRLVPSEVVRSGSTNLVKHLKNTSEVTVALLDAETNGDLSVIAQAGLQIRQEIIFVGSAGLAHQIAALWRRETNGRDELPLVRAEVPDSFTRPTPGPAEARPYRTDKPVLIVIGSKSPVSRTQFEQLSNSGGVDVLQVKISALQSGGDSAIVAAVSRALVNGRDLAITTELPDSVNDGGTCGAVAREGGREAHAIIGSQEGAALMRILGTTLRPFLHKFSSLILTGGETARGVLTPSGIGRLRMLDEIEPGVPLCLSLGNLEIPIIMKAGAFGTPSTLLHALHFLRSHKE
jgi:D-threonate/D-erythronate kinase